MTRTRMITAALFGLLAFGLAAMPGTAYAEKRIALVIGNAGYQAGALNTPANDAGLIAQTLQAAGFDVAGARDLDQDSLRHAFRDFVEKATSSGPDTVVFIYVSGYGLQLEGENYFVPIDARIPSDVDIASEAIRLSDYSRPLAALKLKASIVVLDAARAGPYAKSGQPIAGGLALVDPDPGLLVAFNAAPGTVAPEGQGSLRALCASAGRNDPRRRAAARRGVRARTAAGQRHDGGCGSAVARIQGAGAGRVLRAGGRRAASCHFRRANCCNSCPADPRDGCSGRLYRGSGARCDRWLHGLCCRVPR